LEDLGLKEEELASNLEITKMEMPPSRQAGKIIDGTPEEAARCLVELLRKEAKVI
jgi:electron transfer flavoprotein beta subunit